MHIDEVNSNFVVEVQKQRKLAVELAVCRGLRYCCGEGSHLAPLLPVSFYRMEGEVIT